MQMQPAGDLTEGRRGGRRVQCTNSPSTLAREHRGCVAFTVRLLSAFSGGKAFGEALNSAKPLLTQCASLPYLPRLYSQAEAMCKHYKTPVLLIEFDSNKTFGLQVRGWPRII